MLAISDEDLKGADRKSIDSIVRVLTNGMHLSTVLDLFLSSHLNFEKFC